MNYSIEAQKIVNDAENKLNFQKVNDIALYNQAKILDAFKNHRLAYRHFAPSNGYGYGDSGRETLNSVFAEVMRAEDAIVSPYIAAGTHALSLMLLSLLRPNDTLLSISGKPYETLHTVISGDNKGSLKDFGINYKQVELSNGKFDYAEIKKALKGIKVIFITRSRGYEWRDAQSIEEIRKVIEFIRSFDKTVIIAVDNCYGEFVDKIEPIEAGADIMAGSLIKNPGGGLAPSGGYIAGKKSLIEQVAYRLTVPGLGSEIGSYAYGYQLFFQGLFMAPSTVLAAVKTSMLMGQVYHDIGLPTMPLPSSYCNDIIRSIRFPDADSLIDFCRSIQEVSPIDSHVRLEPWAMPGYESDVIMAAGTFVAGASIELSADSPIREPYIAYMQGALTYEHGKIATLYSLDRYLKSNKTQK